MSGHLRIGSWALLGAALGCSSSSPSGGGADEGATGGVATVGGDDASSGADGASFSTGSSGPDDCTTVLCGEPAECCAAQEECAGGSCRPFCESGIRCGDDSEICCAASEVCLGDGCVGPTGSCQDSFDCEAGEFCEPTLDQCLPQLDPVTCEVEPEFEAIDVVEEWSFEDAQIIAIPVVGDLDGDDAPEAVVNLTNFGERGFLDGDITILDGRDGSLKRRIEHDPSAGTYGSHGRATPGISDVNGDGNPDIVYAGRPPEGSNRSQIIAVDGPTGDLLWRAEAPGGGPAELLVVNGAPSFGNFDDDPETEIVFGATLIDHDGRLVWNEQGSGAAYGTNNNYTGGISAVVDLTGDGYPEIVSGRHAWSVDWNEEGGVPNVTVTELWAAPEPDGYPAIADFDLDGQPEVVLVAEGTVRILEGATGLPWCGVDPSGAACQADPSARTQAIEIPGGGRGGPPTVADFDGDGRPEIATAGGVSYTVYDIAREGEEIVQPPGAPAPAPGDVFVRWSRGTRDASSNATGSSVFDFQGDGIAEVIYGDECYMRVYSGLDGAVLLEVESSSATIHEYPIVVDVDGDGNSEILVVSNDSGAQCDDIEGYTKRQGIFVYGDTFDQWVRTRRVWNSHTYHVTNATAVGNTPATELDNWTQPGLNNYRQNVQGEGVFNAPDLSLELSAGLGACIDEELELVATVRNEGALGVAAGVDVALYEGTDATGTLIGSMPTTEALLPGQSTNVTFVIPFPLGSPAMDYYAVVDGAEDAGAVLECDESNNDGTIATVACPIPG